MFGSAIWYASQRQLLYVLHVAVLHCNFINLTQMDKVQKDILTFELRSWEFN